MIFFTCRLLVANSVCRKLYFAYFPFAILLSVDVPRWSFLEFYFNFRCSLKA